MSAWVRWSGSDNCQQYLSGFGQSVLDWVRVGVWCARAETESPSPSKRLSCGGAQRQTTMKEDGDRAGVQPFSPNGAGRGGVAGLGGCRHVLAGDGVTLGWIPLSPPSAPLSATTDSAGEKLSGG
ncbi:hypothetical protein NDU88_010743 [Pleurodeles waltl]|uniref:Uncharacterized protein n=1 Tax=Pleurodeles waltl TaxID=8319 RepID=A0AAV7PZM5_PLEWA|nr:hypothetical protein NDU88_010743 [Pleurodeles waltl]